MYNNKKRLYFSCVRWLQESEFLIPPLYIAEVLLDFPRSRGDCVSLPLAAFTVGRGKHFKLALTSFPFRKRRNGFTKPGCGEDRRCVTM